MNGLLDHDEEEHRKIKKDFGKHVPGDAKYEKGTTKVYELQVLKPASIPDGEGHGDVIAPVDVMKENPVVYNTTSDIHLLVPK